jgi:hypothetical protein
VARRVSDVKAVFAGLRGQEFITAMRALALVASAQDRPLRCGGSGCGQPAAFVGMQRCGAPGGPVCQICLQAHSEWVTTAEVIAELPPYCRHCGEDVDRSHVYAVDLWEGSEIAV